MTTREEALAFGLSYPDTCQDAPFHDQNWQLVRIKSSKKVFLWTYEKDVATFPTSGAANVTECPPVWKLTTSPSSAMPRCC